MMIAEIGTGLSSLKAAFDLAKDLNSATNQAALNAVKIDLQSNILNAQAALAAARDEDATTSKKIEALEKEIVRLKDWEGEKQRYELKAIDAGAFAYVLKPGVENGQPPHWLCTNCFDDGHRSILQFQRSLTSAGPAVDLWRCNRCRGELSVFFRNSPARPWKPLAR